MNKKAKVTVSSGEDDWVPKLNFEWCDINCKNHFDKHGLKFEDVKKKFQDNYEGSIQNFRVDKRIEIDILDDNEKVFRIVAELIIKEFELPTLRIISFHRKEKFAKSKKERMKSLKEK